MGAQHKSTIVLKKGLNIPLAGALDDHEVHEGAEVSEMAAAR